MKSAFMIMFLTLATVNGQNILSNANMSDHMMSDLELKNATGANSYPCLTSGTDCSSTTSNPPPPCNADCSGTTIKDQTGGGTNFFCIKSPYADATSTCTPNHTNCYTATQCECQFTTGGCTGGIAIGPIMYGTRYNSSGIACP